MKHFVYIHTAPSGHQYVGIHSGNNVEERWGKDGSGYKTQKKFYRAIEKYTFDGFYHDWWEVDSRRQAEAEEMYLIEALDSKNNGYNATDGGEGTSGWHPSDEARVKMRENHADVSGENNPMYGKKRPDHAAKMSGENHPFYGKKRPEFAAKMKGKKRPDHAAKMKGENNPMYGKKRPKSEEEKAKCTVKKYRNKLTGHITVSSRVTYLINQGKTTQDEWELVENN